MTRQINESRVVIHCKAKWGEELGELHFPLELAKLEKQFGNYERLMAEKSALETAIALHYLIFDGVLERHPNLKVLAVHGGAAVAPVTRGDMQLDAVHEGGHGCFLALR